MTRYDVNVISNGDENRIGASPAPGWSKQRQLSVILSDNLRLMAKTVSHRESRLAFGRVLRTTAAVRSQLTGNELKCFFQTALGGKSDFVNSLLRLLSDEAMQQVFFVHFPLTVYGKSCAEL